MFTLTNIILFNINCSGGQAENVSDVVNCYNVEGWCAFFTKLNAGFLIEIITSTSITA